jgi:hypothetical protein
MAAQQSRMVSHAPKNNLSKHANTRAKLNSYTWGFSGPPFLAVFVRSIDVHLKLTFQQHD